VKEKSKGNWVMNMKRVMTLIVVCALFAAPALTQQQATLTGTVTDSTGAVVPGAKVQLLNKLTKESYTSVTGAAGNYTMTFIKPGTYELTAESVGFKKHSQPGVRLDTAAHTRVDVKLQLGEVTESVTVEADVPLLKTENSSVATVI
jgi:hypothetical protein